MIELLNQDFLQLYLPTTSETRDPGGVRVCFRSLRTLLLWIESDGADDNALIIV